MTEDEIDDFRDEIMEAIGEVLDDTALPWETSVEGYEAIATDCQIRAAALRQEHAND